MGHREARNRDRFSKKNYPIQTYAITGHEHGKITGLSEGIFGSGKNILDGPPMVITPTPPGAYAYDDDAWGATFGASMDSTMTLFPVDKVKPLQSKAKGTLQEEGQVFADAIPHADNLTLYKDILGNQQVKFLVSDNIATAQGADKVSDYSKVRSIGMRGPMQYGGWGKTIGMRTTDSDPADFRKADDEHKLDMATWKYGPVDLRWDDVRNVWRGFNDLIADMPDSKKNEGTLVFGTNDDASCGFPYLKGKLEDVWWVRKTVDEADIIGDTNDRLKSAKVLTHLAHNWFDVKENCYAPMNSIFLIHRDPTDETKCGTETTSKCPAIELYHDVYFHHRACEDKHGPIKFVCDKISDCEEEQQGQMKFDGEKWIPIHVIDPCSKCHAGSQFSTTFSNDVALAQKICEVCQLVLKLHGFGKNSPKPDQVGQSAAAANTASGSAQAAADAFNDIPDGNDEALNDAAGGAAAEYQEAANAQATSAAAQTTAAVDQSSSNDAASVSAAAEVTAAAANAEFQSNFKPDGTPKPGKTQKIKNDFVKAEVAELAASAAKAAANAAAVKAAKSQATADEARANAATASQAAKNAHEEWKKQKAKNGDELTEEETEADQAGEEADVDGENAEEVGEDANETPPSAKECADKNAGAIANLIGSLGGADGIANMAGGNAATPGEVNDAINDAEAKANDAVQSVVAAVNDAIATVVDSVNNAIADIEGAGTVVSSVIDTTGTAIGQNAGVGEAGTGDGGANTGDGETSVPEDDGDVDDPAPPAPPDTPTPDATGTGSVLKPDPTETPSGGPTTGLKPPGTPTETPTGGRPPTVTPPPVEKPPAPDCGVITITDPCTNKTKVISCGGGGGPDTTTPEGQPTPDGGPPTTGSPPIGLTGPPGGATGLGIGGKWYGS